MSIREPDGELVARIAGLTIVAEVWQQFGVGVPVRFEVWVGHGSRYEEKTLDFDTYAAALRRAVEVVNADLHANRADMPESLEVLCRAEGVRCGDCGSRMERTAAGYRCPNQAAHS